MNLVARVKARIKYKAAPRDPRWPVYRYLHLQHEPACRACGSRLFREVHHIKPFHEFPELELVDGNMVTLCRVPLRNCHFNIGHHRDWSKSNPDVLHEADEAYARRKG